MHVGLVMYCVLTTLMVQVAEVQVQHIISCRWPRLGVALCSFIENARFSHRPVSQSVLSNAAVFKPF
jgi:hypothetical protein